MDKFKNKLKWFFTSFIWLGILLFVLDVISKQIVKNNMNVYDTIWIIPNFLDIQYVHNSGMAFGLNTGNPVANAVIFIAISLIGTAILLFVLIKYWKKLNMFTRASIMLMLTGCVGNLIDRAFYIDANGAHYVVDFIGVEFGSWSFPRFNVADSCLVIGVIMLVIYFIYQEIQNNKKEREKEKLTTVKKEENNENKDE